jgi:hypothetical protein
MKTGAYGLAVVFMLAACATESSRGLEYRTAQSTNSAEIVAALDRAEAQWRAAGITSYSLRIRRGGAFGGSVFKATYELGSCRATHLKDVGLPSSFTCEKNSMSQLFAEVRNEVTSGDGDVWLSLDPEIGYIHWFSVEPHTNLTDQGWGVEITHFRVLK